MPTTLVVDDNANNIDILVALLNEYNVLVSLNATNAMALTKDNNIDLILLDIMMPEVDGIEMAQQLKKNSESKNIPILFLTAKGDDESIEKCFDAGGADFITKPFSPRALLARVKTHLKMYEQLKELEHIANYDYLSGAYNRRSFFERSSDYLSEAKRGEVFAVMIDIDKFKNINDIYGHSVGDSVIKLLSKTVQDLLDDGMLFARVGGEEFVVLTRKSNKQSIVIWVENIRQAIENLEVIVNGQIVQFSISCGISEFKEDTKSIDELLDIADQGLYEAKETGRNKVVFRK